MRSDGTSLQRAAAGICQHVPARPGDEQRPLRADVLEDAGELLEAPADDHAFSRSRAKATNACAALEPARPDGAGDVDVAREVEPADARLGQRPGRQLGRDRLPGDEADAEAALHRAPHRLLEPELERHLQIPQPLPALAQLVLDHLPDAGARAASGSAGPRASSSSPTVRAGERMPGRAGEDHLVAEERLEGDGAVAAGGADDPELQPPVGDQLDHRLRVEDRQLDAQLGVLRAGTRRAGAAGRSRPGRWTRRARASRAAARRARRARRAAAPRARASAARRGTAAARPRSARPGGRTGRAAAGPSRCSSARTCCETAGWVTPSREAASEKLRRSTTSQKAASWRVSISGAYPVAPLEWLADACLGRPDQLAARARLPAADRVAAGARARGRGHRPRVRPDHAAARAARDRGDGRRPPRRRLDAREGAGRALARAGAAPLGEAARASTSRSPTARTT